MPDYDDTNRGILWHNPDKKSEKAPDYTGKYNHEGEEIKIAGWLKTSKNGKTFISISKDTYEKTDRSQSDMWPAKQEVPIVGEIDEQGNINLDDIPF